MSTTYTGDPTNDPASITIPSDGQGPIKAADVNPAFEALADKIAYGREHGWLATYLAEQHDDTLGTAFSTWDAGTTGYVVAAGPNPMTLSVPNVKVGDTLEIDITGIMLYACTTGPDVCLFEVSVVDDASGAAVAHTLKAHASVDLLNGETRNGSIAIAALHSASNAGTSTINIYTRSLNNAGNAVVAKSYSIRARHMRSL